VFCGLGGWSEAAAQADCEVILAANHWEIAIRWHRANHSRSEYYEKTLHDETPWWTFPYCDIFLASPQCTGHTWARGKEAKHHAQDRATAWVVLNYAEHAEPPIIIVENVVEFLDWKLYRAWKTGLEDLGYAVKEHVFDAADCGVPQNRERVYIVANWGKHPIPIQLPEQRQHVAVKSYIDWGDRYNWSLIDKPGRAKRTLERIENGRRAHGDRFVFPYYSAGSGLTGRSIDRPIGTLTTKARWGIANGQMMRMLHSEEARAIMGFPDNYKIPANEARANKLIGNAVSPPAGKHLLDQVVTLF